MAMPKRKVCDRGEMISVHVKIHEDIISLLRAQAAHERRYIGEMIREAITEFLVRRDILLKNFQE